MSNVELLKNEYPESFSKKESLQLLDSYKNQLTPDEYKVLRDSLCSHALEYMFLNEKDILMSVALLHNEIGLEEIVKMVKTS